MKKISPLFLLLATACNNGEADADAYGNFEATEITVSAEQPGQIKKLQIEEGAKLTEGQVVGYIDTTNLHLQKRQLLARNELLRAKSPHISSEINVLREQRQNVAQELERFTKLSKSGAVPQKQVDDLENQKAVLNRRMEAVRTKDLPLSRELDLNRIQIEQLNEQVSKARITAPVGGTVLLQLAEEGEITNPGMPIFRMAKLDHLRLKAYISARQIDDIRLGQKVTVRTDEDEDSYNRYTGRITWISDKAEFTPRTIQTKEERTDLVYAIKIKVANDGSLKIGMPGEVIFNADHTDEND